MGPDDPCVCGGPSQFRFINYNAESGFNNGRPEDVQRRYNCLIKGRVVVLDPRLVAVATGMLAGLYPAAIAARLTPVDALRG